MSLPRRIFGTRARRACIALLTLVATSFAADDAAAQIRIGFCQGPPGDLVTVTVEFKICCPPLGTISTISATAGPVSCDDAGAVMGALNAAVAGLVFGGGPVFGTPVAVPSPVPGQARFEYPLDPDFVASDCCVVGGSIDFDCGTFSLRMNAPCPKAGDPGGGGRVTKLCFDSPSPPSPSTVAVMFEGCPLVTVPVPPGAPADLVRDAVLAALLAEGYTAEINADGKLEVTGDCTGMEPTGVDEFGVVGGLPMDLGIVICPPPLTPVPNVPGSWGAIKSFFASPE